MRVKDSVATGASKKLKAPLVPHCKTCHDGPRVFPVKLPSKSALSGFATTEMGTASGTLKGIP